MIVADANVIAYFSLTSPYSELSEQLHKSDPHWIAPALWSSEIHSVFVQYLKRSVLTLQQALTRLATLELMFDQRVFEVPSASVLALAIDSGCSAYDCEYVALAQQMNCSLVTMDKKLVREFPKTAILLTDT
jgi:predicted nucleic acid-binding protein